jgi:hypothetical protein
MSIPRIDHKNKNVGYPLIMPCEDSCRRKDVDIVWEVLRAIDED